MNFQGIQGNSDSSFGWVQELLSLGPLPGPAIQLATKPAFHLVIKSSLNPTEIPLNLTDNPPNLTESARNQTERIAVSNAALIAKLMASKLLGSKEKDLLKLLNPPNSSSFYQSGPTIASQNRAGVRALFGSHKPFNLNSPGECLTPG